MKNNLKINDKVQFHNEVPKYTVKAISKCRRFVICTRPYNLKKTVFYTILDFFEEIRSTNSYIFNPFDYKDQNDINDCIEELISGESELSRRNKIELIIVE